VTHRGHRIADIVLLDDHNVIGRDQDCEVVIDDKFFSRRYAVINHEDDGWVLRDLNSTNGTWVNGTTARTWHLKDGDIIEIGKHRLVFVAGRAADVGVATQSMVDR
jgi:pSer/pThr/pTyr-binding forkhead associated (FHA) protein